MNVRHARGFDSYLIELQMPALEYSELLYNQAHSTYNHTSCIEYTEFELKTGIKIYAYSPKRPRDEVKCCQ